MTSHRTTLQLTAAILGALFMIALVVLCERKSQAMEAQAEWDRLTDYGTKPLVAKETR